MLTMCSRCSRQERPLFGKLVQRLQEHIKHYEALHSQYEAVAIHETHMVMACNCISAPYQTTYMVKYGEYPSVLKDTISLQLLFRNFPAAFHGYGDGSRSTWTRKLCNQKRTLGTSNGTSNGTWNILMNFMRIRSDDIGRIG